MTIVRIFIQQMGDAKKWELSLLTKQSLTLTGRGTSLAIFITVECLRLCVMQCLVIFLFAVVIEWPCLIFVHQLKGPGSSCCDSQLASYSFFHSQLYHTYIFVLFFVCLFGFFAEPFKCKVQTLIKMESLTLITHCCLIHSAYLNFFNFPSKIFESNFLSSSRSSPVTCIALGFLFHQSPLIQKDSSDFFFFPLDSFEEYWQIILQTIPLFWFI